MRSRDSFLTRKLSSLRKMILSTVLTRVTGIKVVNWAESELEFTHIQAEDVGLIIAGYTRSW